MPAKITDAERARRRLHQQQKIAKTRKVLGGGLFAGSVFGIFKLIQHIEEEKRHNAALMWARIERRRIAQLSEAERNLRRVISEAFSEIRSEQQRRNAPRIDAEAKFVADHQPPPIDPNTLPECYGPDPVSQEEVNLKENADAVAIIYERGQPLRAHCYERTNFEAWWAPGNMGSCSLYAYDNPENRSDYQIFRLPNDQTYVTENSTKVILTNPAKIFQRVFYKDVHTHKGMIKLYVLIPVPVT